MAKATQKDVEAAGITSVNRNGMIYNMSNPAHRKALQQNVPPPGTKKTTKK